MKRKLPFSGESKEVPDSNGKNIIGIVLIGII